VSESNTQAQPFESLRGKWIVDCGDELPDSKLDEKRAIKRRACAYVGLLGVTPSQSVRVSIPYSQKTQLLLQPRRCKPYGCAHWQQPAPSHLHTNASCTKRLQVLAKAYSFRAKTFDSTTRRLTIKRGRVRPILRSSAAHSVRPHHVALHCVHSGGLAFSRHVQEPFNPASSIVGPASPRPQPPVVAAGSGVYVRAYHRRDAARLEGVSFGRPACVRRQRGDFARVSGR
jgi:hypothetical protein